MARRHLAPALALLLGACAPAPDAPVFHADANPATLSEWNVLAVKRGYLVPGPGSVHYSVNAPLFTDYAHKLRTVHTPEPAGIREDGSLDFPVGTVISKTFYYPEDAGGVRKTPDGSPDAVDLAAHRLIETRLMVRREAGWEPVSYVWDEDETEARLKRTGAVVRLASRDLGDFAYLVPNENQCAGCHATDAGSKALHPLGASAGQFADRSAMVVSGVMRPGTFAEVADWRDESLPLDSRARAYLDGNCAHCHNPVGPADTSGLDLTLGATSALALGRCKPPIAAGSGTGGRLFSIVPGKADASIMPHRMASTDPGAMMPELGRTLAHAEGVALISDWIDAMEGGCAG